MIDILEWVFAVLGYIGIGLGIARSQAKRIYREMQKHFRGRSGNCQAAYHGSLQGWVFFWPFRTLSVVLKFCLYHGLIHPAEVTASWAADLVKAPVASTLNAIKETEAELDEWTKLLKNPKADEDERDIARHAWDAAVERQKAACEDLGIQVPMRRAISSGSTDDSIARGLRSAREVLKDRSYVNEHWS